MRIHLFCILVSLLMEPFLSLELSGECSLIEQLKERFSIKFRLIIVEKNFASYNTYLYLFKKCFFIAGRVEVQSNLCSQLKRNYTAPQLLIFPFHTNFQAIKKIQFNRCDINNIFLFFWKDDVDFFPFFNSIHFSMNCLFFVAISNSSGYYLNEISKATPTTPLQITSLDQSHWDLIPRDNFQRLEFNLGMLNLPPNGIIISDKIIKDKKEFHGIFIDVITIMEKKLNFKTSKVLRSNDFGIPLENGSWTGLVGEVQRGELDIAISIVMNSGRLETILFLRHLYPNRITMFIQIPKTKRNQINWTAYLRPFEFYFWIALLGMIIIITLWDTGRKNIYFHFFQFQITNLIIENLYNSLLWILSVICQQSSNYGVNLLSVLSVRVTLLVVLCFSLFLYICYSACLISFLIVEDNSLAFKDLAGFLKHGVDYRVQIPDRAIQLVIIKKSSDPKLQQLYTNFLAREVNSLPDNYQGYRNVRASPRYGFISLEIIGKYFYKQNHIHNIYRFNIMPQPLFLSFIMKKQSPYKRPMNKMIQRMHESGIIKYIMMKYSGDQIVEELQMNSFSSITLTILLLPFLLYICGISLSFLIFIFEKYSYKKKNNYNITDK